MSILWLIQFWWLERIQEKLYCDCESIPFVFSWQIAVMGSSWDQWYLCATSFADAYQCFYGLFSSVNHKYNVTLHLCAGRFRLVMYLPQRISKTAAPHQEKVQQPHNLHYRKRYYIGRICFCMYALFNLNVKRWRYVHIIGYDEYNDPTLSLEEALVDTYRIDYYYRHLYYLQSAIR